MVTITENSNTRFKVNNTELSQLYEILMEARQSIGESPGIQNFLDIQEEVIQKVLIWGDYVEANTIKQEEHLLYIFAYMLSLWKNNNMEDLRNFTELYEQGELTDYMNIPAGRLTQDQINSIKDFAEHIRGLTPTPAEGGRRKTKQMKRKTKKHKKQKKRAKTSKARRNK